jgi:hypothetical protein
MKSTTTIICNFNAIGCDLKHLENKTDIFRAWILFYRNYVPRYLFMYAKTYNILKLVTFFQIQAKKRRRPKPPSFV